jgi:aspartyl-tRNA synthetase
MAERMYTRIWRDVLDQDLDTPFERLPHAEAMERFGTDRPDLRIRWELCDLTPVLTGIGFGIFDGAAAAGGRVRGFVAKGGATLSRSRIEHYNQRAQEVGAKGALWLKRTDDGWSGQLAKVIGEDVAPSLEALTGVEPGDLIFVVAGPDHESSPALDLLRREVAEEIDAVRDEHRWVWITEFPLFELDHETGAVAPAQHAFTMPADPNVERIRDDPMSMNALAYDVVYNGREFGSGSIRCHYPDVQRAILAATGLSDEEIEARFGFLLEAFRYGVPPHGGVAFGLDRMVMVMAGAASMRDVIAFPKTTAARGLLERSPSTVAPEELADLGISIDP